MIDRLALITLCALIALPVAGAESRLYFEDITAPSGAAGLEIPLLADSDMDILGFSFGIRYDPTALDLVSVTKEGTDAAAAAFFEGNIVEEEGLIGYGCVVSIYTDPRASKIPSGSRRQLAKLVVNVIGAPGSTTEVILDTVPTNDDPETPVKCVLTDDRGWSVVPTLVSGSITVADRRPQITGFEDNEGEAGTQFRILGNRLDEPGLSVTVCDSSAAATLEPGGASILVTAPPCGASGPATVKVCTDYGCDERADGFTYLVADVPFVRGNANADEAVDIADGVRILIYLFVGGVTSTCLDALDADDTGVVDVSDAVYVLDYLFKGGSPIPAPFPGVGIDPTEDLLPPCE